VGEKKKEMKPLLKDSQDLRNNNLIKSRDKRVRESLTGILLHSDVSYLKGTAAAAFQSWRGGIK